MSFETQEIKEQRPNSEEKEHKYYNPKKRVETIRTEELISQAKELKSKLEGINVNNKWYWMMLMLMCNKADDFLAETSINNDINAIFEKIYDECLEELNKNREDKDEVDRIVRQIEWNDIEMNFLVSASIVIKWKEYINKFKQDFNDFEEWKNNDFVINLSNDFRKKRWEIKNICYNQGIPEENIKSEVGQKIEKTVGWLPGVYETFKDFNFDSILSFWKDGISFRPGQEKQNQKWSYIDINGTIFYNSKTSDGSKPKDWYVYYISKNLLYLSEIRDWKFFWDWLQINRDKDIIRIKQVY